MAQSLDRGLRILDEIAAGRTTLGAIADSLGVHKSTVLRLLATLQQHHFVYREDASNYRLGRRLYDLASFVLDSQDVVGAARAPMRALAEHTRHTVYLATLEGAEGAVVALVRGRGAIQASVRVGAPLSLSKTAAGLVLLAGLSDSEQEAHVASLPPEAQPAVRTALQEAAASGFATELGADDPLVNAVATEIRSGEQTIAALAVSGPSAALDEASIAKTLPHLFETAADISKELGWDDR